MPTATAAKLTRFADATLQAIGLSAADARFIARCLVLANLRGVDTHGVLRLIQYVECVRGGEVNPRPVVRVTSGPGVTALVDADGGYGFVPMMRAVELAMTLAAANGIGLVGVRNSHHFGMGAAFVRPVVDKGLIGIVTTNTGPVMAPEGVLTSVVGNNPVAIGVPRRPPNAALLLDMALSATALGRIRLAAAEGRAIPLGWALDETGAPTTDAHAALRAGLLVPVGGYKGYGLSIMLEVLTGILTGSPFGSGSSAHAHREGGVGHLALVIRPSLFIAEDQFFDSVERLVAEIKSARVSGDAELLLPGEIEDLTMREREKNGIPITAALAAQLSALGKELGVDVHF